MKTKVLWCLAAFSAAGALGFAADTPSDNSARVTVDFSHPDKFTDANDSAAGRDASNSSYLPMLKEYVQKVAPRYLGPGEKLSVTFTDIDLAGEYEPWRSSSIRDARIVKAIYPPRLKFDYVVTDASNTVVKSGHASISDMNFQMDVTNAINHDDPLRYEKRLFDSWLTSELRSSNRKKS
jgi:DUF3016 family protein